jgi:hypothetical protein
LNGISPEERKSIYLEMNRVMVELHSLDVERMGLGDFGGKGEYYKR